MKRVALLLLVTLVISFASAEIIIDKQPSEVYNFGDQFTIPLTIKSVTEKTGSLELNLICDGQEMNFYKNGIFLTAGQEKQIESSLIVSKEFLGNLSGSCVIKGTLGGEFVTSDKFKISKLITLTPGEDETLFEPEQNVLITGEARKENGNAVDGFIDLEIVINNETSMIQRGTIQNGFYSLNITFPKELPAGKYLMTLNAYEQDSDGMKTNTGFINQNIDVKQVPTSLEIVIEESEVEPGTNLKLRTILHDQTGVNIPDTSILTIKDNKSRILEQVELQTDEIFEFSIAHDEAPLIWTAYAISNQLDSELNFNIKEKKDVNITMINDTVVITNSGNVFYNNSVGIKFANETLNVYVELEVGESEEFRLTAPDGQYEIKIMEDGGETVIQSAVLTGRSIDIKSSEGKSRAIFAWVFIIIILGLGTYLTYNRIKKKNVFAKMPKLSGSKKVKNATVGMVPIAKDSLVNSKNKAEMSLSIRGDRQVSMVVCLKVKNLKDLQKKETSTTETLQKIVNFAESHKAAVYENGEDVFFIIAPSMTKTFKNEKKAFEVARVANKLLDEHNRLYKQKIEFGVSINKGTMIINSSKAGIKFMSIGSTISSAKKLASISEDGEIYMTRDVSEGLRTEVKTKREERSGQEYYVVKEIKHYPHDAKKFIDDFVKNNIRK